jgi:GH25 family lysozyme M1 (1,4-beta-N-acetylmuramidase)
MFPAIDVYHGNDPAAIAQAEAHADAVIVKASEALSRDTGHDAIVANARNAGKLIGHYHFGWFGENMDTQAAFFVNVAKPLPGDTIWLDVERESGDVIQWPASAPVRVAAVLAFAYYASHLTGARCGHYANRSDWAAMLNAATPIQRAALLTYPLWIADPSSPAGKPAISEPWFMQQTGSPGNIDHDLVNGTTYDWLRIAVPEPVKPPSPTPTPLPPSPYATKDDKNMMILRRPNGIYLYIGGRILAVDPAAWASLNGQNIPAMACDDQQWGYFVTAFGNPIV